jgi:malonyl CoA-acyl carrier protein transacylase
MPDNNEKERRKLIAKELRLKAKEEFENSLPIRRDFFLNLFDYLDEELSENECDHNLELTIKFLKSSKIENIDIVTNWLKENGGYCDCEVLANVEKMFDDNPIL